MRLFVTDYDETLFTSEDTLKTNLKKLKELQKKDFYIVIATGRSYPSIKMQVEKYHLVYDFLVCADGSVIFDKEGKLIYQAPLDKKIVEPFRKFYEDLPYDEIQFAYPEEYSNNLDEDKKLLGINVCISTRLYNDKIEKQFYKMGKHYLEYHFLAYMHPNYSYLCIKPYGIDKSSAITFLKEKYKILEEDIYVIGDSYNDLEMIRDFHGVGMNSSCDEVLKMVNKTYDEVYEYLDEIKKNF